MEPTTSQEQDLTAALEQQRDVGEAYYLPKADGWYERSFIPRSRMSGDDNSWYGFMKVKRGKIIPKRTEVTISALPEGCKPKPHFDREVVRLMRVALRELGYNDLSLEGVTASYRKALNGEPAEGIIDAWVYGWLRKANVIEES